MINHLEIKVCGMKYKVNLYQVSGLNPNYLGFIFYRRSPRYMADLINPSDLSGIPASIKKVGVFVNEPKEDILHRVETYHLDVVQLHGNETPSYCKFLYERGISVWKAVGLADSEDFGKLEQYAEYCTNFLFDKKTIFWGGSGKKFNWKLLEKYMLGTPFFLSGGLGPGDINSIKSVSHEKLAGVDLNSGFESEPGMKNIKLLENFINELLLK